jgi:opacity protein-like surface antigen
MKRIVGAVMVTAALTAPGLAADLGARSFTKAPVAAPVSTWSGLYVGGNLGYGWGNGNTDFSFLPDPVTFGLTTQVWEPDRPASPAAHNSATIGRSAHW